MFKSTFTAFIIAGLLIVQAQNAPKAPTNKATPKTNSSSKTSGKPSAKKPVGKVNYTINGKVEGYPNHLVILSKFRINSLELVDSVLTNDSGYFTFKKPISEASILYIQYNTQSAVPLVVENGAKLNVKISPTSNGLNYDVTGLKSDKSKNIYNFIRQYTRLNNELAALDRAIAEEPDGTKMYELQMVFGTKQEEFRSSIDSMLKFHAPLESYFVLFNFMEEQDFQKIKALKIRMEPQDIKSNYYIDLKTIYDNNKLLEVGELAPEIELPQVDGSILKLSDLRGKIVLIDFWASWCGPCRAEFPFVKALYAKYQSKGFEIYGVSLDKDRPSWVSSINSLGLNWKHVSDLKFWNCAPAKIYKVSGIPFTVLIDKEGKIIAKNLRGEDLERKLEELFP
jgi:peroxiredoxin